MSTVVFSSYPLSRNFKDKIETNEKFISKYISINELKDRSIIKLIKNLVQIKYETLIIGIEEESAQMVLPTLKIISSFTSCRTLKVSYPNGTIEQFSRLQILGYLFWMVIFNIHARAIKLYSYLEATYLLKVKRIQTKPNFSKDIIYIKSNLWFGVKAGGSVGHIAGVINGFLRKGWKVIYYGVEKPVMTDQQLKFINVDSPRIMSFPPDINNFTYNKSLYDVCNNHNSHFTGCVYQRLSINNYAGVVVSRKLKVPLIVEYNGSEVWVSNNWGQKLRYQKHSELCEEVCLKHAHMVVTISDVLKEELISRGIEEKRIVSYPNCVDENIFNPTRFTESDKDELRKKLGFEKDDLIATFVGTFGKWHGVNFLAESIIQLINNNEEDLKRLKLKFLIVGDGALMNEVKEILSRTDKIQYFLLAGLIEQSKAPIYLACSDILLSPHVENSDGSRFFGSPTKLFEYMCMGKPIIASRLEQIEEVLKGNNESNGNDVAALFTPGNHTEFKKKLLAISENAQEREKLGSLARSRALKNYTWSKHVDQIVNGFKTIGM